MKTLISLLVIVPVSPASFAQLSVVAEAELVATPHFANGWGWDVDLDGDTQVIGSPFINNDRGHVAVFVETSSGWIQQAVLSPADLLDGDRFGYRVALDRDTIVVSAFGHPTDGLDGSGAAYVFTRSGTIWSQQAKLVSPAPERNGGFGTAVAVKGDRAVIGAIGEIGFYGQAHVFERAGSLWTHDTTLRDPFETVGADRFGSAAALSGDTILIGVPFAHPVGAAFVFVRGPSGWIQEQKLVPGGVDPSAQFGRRVSLEGNRAVISASSSQTGAVAIYERVAGVWSEVERLPTSGNPSGSFGFSLALDGDRIVVGNPADTSAGAMTGAVFVFDRFDGQWSQTGKIVAADAASHDGLGISAGLHGDRVAAGGSGQARIFELESAHGSYCEADGGTTPGCTPCPCGNDAVPPGTGGCLNSDGRSARLRATGTAAVSSDTLRLEVVGASQHGFGVLASADNRLPQSGACPAGSGLATSVLDGLRCIGGGLLRHGGRALNFSGNNTSTWGFGGAPANGLLQTGGFIAGQVRHYQVFYRTDPLTLCGTGQNTTNAVTVTVLP